MSCNIKYRKKDYTERKIYNLIRSTSSGLFLTDTKIGGHLITRYGIELCGNDNYKSIDYVDIWLKKSGFAKFNDISLNDIQVNGTLNVEKIIDPSKTNRGLTFLSKSPDGEFQFLKQTETKKNVSDAERDAFYDTEITRIAKDVNEPGDIVIQREIAPGQMMDYYVVEGRGDATDVGYRMIPLKENENADDALIKIVEYNPSAIDMYTISFDPSKLEEPMYLFKKKSGGTIDKDSLVSITDIYGEYGR